MPWTDAPGTEPTGPDRRKRLLLGLAKQGADYVPRTHHLREDGAPVYTNDLILQTSPYLLQHAHNPVAWMAWGEEAFARARALDRPILLSIGYSTCHWCHVMERESFEDEEIARYINEGFVAIKVDREERPDIDSIYMDAVRAMTGRGGWPLTAILNADREPFFGGTYFPARDGDRGSRMGFLTVLQQIRDVWETDRPRITEQARRLSKAVERAAQPGLAGDAPGIEVLSRATAQWASGFDEQWGGFSKDKKFPRPSVLRALLRAHLRGEEKALPMVVRTLDRMMEGGIHDQLGGGFHRYTVERTWLVPHFEKMLYDNAQLVLAYLEAAQVTGRADYKAVARETLDYVAREMTHKHGGFFSATDADSMTPEGHSEEGWFFTWTPAELEEALGQDAAKHFAAFYGVTQRGNFEGRNIFTARRSLTEVAEQQGVATDALERQLAESRKTLYALRAQRPAPGLDDKILSAWNGLMISAFVRGAVVLRSSDDLQRAAAAADFILSSLRRKDGRLLRSWRGTAGEAQGVVDDYAFLIAALLDLFEATSEARWLDEALSLQGILDSQFADEAGGGYFFTAADGEVLLARQKPAYDGAVPTGNAVAAANLLRLAELTGEQVHRDRAERIFSALSTTLRRGPTSAPELLVALDRAHSRGLEVVIICPEDRSEAASFQDVLASTFVPGMVSVVTIFGKDQKRLAKQVPWVADRPTANGAATAYVCREGVCKLPTTDPTVFLSQLLED
jgi:uncharacterized protein YyaL (SSP411 family)